MNACFLKLNIIVEEYLQDSNGSLEELLEEIRYSVLWKLLKSKDLLEIIKKKKSSSALASSS